MDHQYIKQQLNIRTNHDYPPIPIRDFDWSAVFDDYDEGDYIGRGSTEEAAVEDLISIVEMES